MKQYWVRAFIMSGISFSNVWAVAGPAEAPRVSVLRFYQQVEHIQRGCRGYEWTAQGQLRTELERALSAEGLVVLERQEIERLYESEHELVNADRRQKPRRGRFKTAQFSIAGGLTELGICEQSGGEGVSLGNVVSWFGGPSDVDFDLSRSKVVSTAKVAAQVISVETGEVLRSFEARAQIKDSGLSVDVGISGVGASKHSAKRAPVERATNKAIRELAKQVARFLKQPS